MSFRCEQCSKAQPHKSKPNVVVVEWYPDRKQIKREKRICDKCAGVVTRVPVPAPVVIDNPVVVKIEIPVDED